MEKHTVSIMSCCNLKKISFCFVKCHGRVRDLFCFLEKSKKTYLQVDLRKNTSSKTP